ncbi:MAG: hypothetical protein KAY03_04390 [Arenimonas sp.]|nr:hypothetical protein [Arenimonas sp.]
MSLGGEGVFIGKSVDIVCTCAFTITTVAARGRDGVDGETCVQPASQLAISANRHGTGAVDSDQD